MWNEVFNLAISNGIFAVLFLLLLIYELRDSNIRERKYQETIERLSNSFSELTVLKGQVDEISEDVEDIKHDITKVVSIISPTSKRKTKTQKEEK